MNKNKKKYIIIGIIAVIIIGAILYFSPRSTNHSHNNTTIDNSYDENFGSNNDVITEPAETEAVTANQNNNFKINYPDETVYFGTSGATKLGMKITDVKASTKLNGDIYLQIELEKISQSNATVEKIKESEEKDGLHFFLDVNIYDKNEMIIDTELITRGNLPFNDPIGTKYTFTKCLYSFSRDNIDISKIDIVEHH